MSSSSPPPFDFPSWLTSTSSTFSNALTSSERVRTLTRLLDACDAAERWTWQTQLTEKLHRDVVAWLPLELAMHILDYLDARSLFKCCQVSSIWRQRIEGSTKLWKRQASIVGAKWPLSDDTNLDVQTLKSLVRNACVQRDRLRSGKAFSIPKLGGFVLSPAYFVALDYHMGFIAAATVDNPDANRQLDRVFVYSTKQGKMIHELKQPREGARASTVKLLFPFYVCAGHLDGSISVWNLPTAHHCELIGHTGAIFALDGDLELDLLVSGSADNNVKVWNLTNCSLMKTFSTQPHWTVSVRLLPWHSSRPPKKTNSLLTLSRDFIHVFRWQTEDELRAKKPPPDLAIPLKQEQCYNDLIRDGFFTPGMHVSHGQITFVKQMPLFETQTIGDADIVTVDMHTGRLCRSIHINQKIRKLLAVGERFALVLLPYVEPKYKNLAVIDLEERKIIGGCTVPHSRASTPDFSQILIGDKDWLHGISPDQTKPGEIMAGLATQDGAITLVRWN